jgi:hypothetical protein
LEQSFDFVDGRLPVPNGPGLGVTVRESALSQFSSK